MTLNKLLVLILVLTTSCKDNKTNSVATKGTTKYISINNVVDTNKIRVVDSNYFEIVNEIKENPYSANYDTTLKGGFSIAYYHDSSDQYLLYKKGQKIIDTIGSCSLGLPYKNLGYVGADFENCFVFVQSFGSGNPHYIQVYDKETAKNLISDFGSWIDVDTNKQVLLFSIADVPSKTDSMTLFDVKKNTKRQYAFPSEIFNEPERLNRIRLLNLTDKEFTIEYDFNDRTITKKKKYSRLHRFTASGADE